VGRPALKREVVNYIVSHYGLKLRRACTLIKQTRSTQYYQSVKDPKTALRQRMHEIARTRMRYGYRRIHVLLKREGWQLGRNQAFRLYQQEQLQLRSKLPRRRKMVVCRQGRIKPTQPDQAWSMDFVADQLANGARFRTLTIIDVFSKEALAIEVGQRLSSDHVVAALNRLPAQRSAPSTCSLTTAASSPAVCWIYGLTITRRESISVGLESQPITAMWKASMDRFAMSA
jgi:putative transposase